MRDGEVVRADDDATLEPALIVNLSNSFVVGVSLANDDRTRTENPDGCDEQVWPYPTGVIFVGARCLGGELLLKPGYNATIRQNAADNSIVLGAVVVADAAVSRPLNAWLEAFLSVENAAEARIETARGADGVVSVAGPRSWRGGIRARW